MGNIRRTENNEAVLGRAMSEVLRTRESSLAGAEQVLRRYQGHLLEPVEVENDEL